MTLQGNLSLIFLFVVACLVFTSCGTGSGDRPTKTIHTWLDSQDDGFHLPSDVQWTEHEGVRLPNQFSIVFADHMASSLDFVLVPSGEVQVDGVTLIQKQPVYMSTTVLSIAQAIMLKDYATASGDLGRSLAGYREKQLAIWYDTVRSRNMYEQFKAYLDNANSPYFVDGLSEVNHLAIRASQRWLCTVRVPTVSEWYHAMRAGRPTRYWWGEKWDTDKVWGEGHKIELGNWQAIQNTDAGVSNPWGLKQMVGGVWQTVTPDAEDRMRLLRACRPGGAIYEAKKNQLGDVFNQKYWLRRYAITAYAPMKLGGSMLFESEKRLPRLAVSLSHAVANPLYGSHHPLQNYGLGVRLVIEPSSIRHDVSSD